MVGIWSKNAKPEITMRKLLYKNGFRFRLHQKNPRNPDIVLKRFKIIIFVNGSFLHRHDCEMFFPKKPKEILKKQIRQKL
ncbi:MAG: hypothetical protein KAZ87_11585 [Spirochaetes bacterium]|nr:hypothetical protein [Spirochaetota bacterium]